MDWRFRLLGDSLPSWLRREEEQFATFKRNARSAPRWYWKRSRCTIKWECWSATKHGARASVVSTGPRGLCRDRRSRIRGDSHRLPGALALGAQLLLPCGAPGDDSFGMRRGTCRNHLSPHEVGKCASAKGWRDRLRARFHRLLA